MSKVLSESVKSQNCAPDDDGSTQVFCDWESLDKPVGRILNEENGDVDTGRQPGELLSDEVEILFHTHDGRETQSTFVESLEEVGEDHDSEDSDVDESFEYGVLLWCDMNGDVASVL